MPLPFECRHWCLLRSMSRAYPNNVVIAFSNKAAHEKSAPMMKFA